MPLLAGFRDWRRNFCMNISQLRSTNGLHSGRRPGTAAGDSRIVPQQQMILGARVVTAIRRSRTLPLVRCWVAEMRRRHSSFLDSFHERSNANA